MARNKKGEGAAAAAPEPPEPFDARAERQSLLDAVHGRGEFGKRLGLSSRDPYQHLLSRERRVLDTVDRVVNDARAADVRHRPFLQLPLHVIGMRAVSSLRAVLDDLVDARSMSAVRDAVLQDDRKVYVGVCLLLLGFCLMFIQATGENG